MTVKTVDYYVWNKFHKSIDKDFIYGHSHKTVIKQLTLTN